MNLLPSLLEVVLFHTLEINARPRSNMYTVILAPTSPSFKVEKSVCTHRLFTKSGAYFALRSTPDCIAIGLKNAQHGVSERALCDRWCIASALTRIGRRRPVRRARQRAETGELHRQVHGGGQLPPAGGVERARPDQPPGAT